MECRPGALAHPDPSNHKHKSMGKNQHVVRRPEGWGVLGAGNKKDTAHVNTQQQAIALARHIAIKQKSEVVIHGRDGKIRDTDSYGNDPLPPKDKQN